MIEIQRDGSNVVLSFQTTIMISANKYPFCWDCKNETYAQLLKEKMSQDLENIVKAVRAQAYNQGYKDGKNHTRKITHFHNNLGITEFIGW